MNGGGNGGGESGRGGRGGGEGGGDGGGGDFTFAVVSIVVGNKKHVPDSLWLTTASNRLRNAGTPVPRSHSRRAKHIRLQS